MRPSTQPSQALRLAQVAVRLRPLNAREVAQGDTEAVTVSSEDQHALQVRCFLGA